MAGEKKPGGWKVPFAGLSGFILGAATVLLIVYLYGRFGGRLETAAPVVSSTPPASAAPLPRRFRLLRSPLPSWHGRLCLRRPTSWRAACCSPSRE